MRTRLAAAIMVSISLLLLMAACEGATGRVTSVSVTPDTVVMAVGETLSLSASVVASGGASEAVRWTSADAGVASVSPSGTLTGVAMGVTTVRAASDADPSVFDEIGVTVEERVAIGPDEDLAATIDGLAVGAIVLLQDATYELPGTLVIAADREIRGSGGTILRTASLAAGTHAVVSSVPDGFGEPVVYAEGITLVLRNMVIEHGGAQNGSVIVLVGGEATLNGITVRNGTRGAFDIRIGHGVLAIDADVLIASSLVEDNGAAGVAVVDGSGRMRVEGSTLRGNGWTGAVVDATSRLELVDVQSLHNTWEGMIARGDATLLVEGGRFAANGNHGIRLWARASAEIQGAVSEDNGVWGMLFEDQSQAEVRNVTVRKNVATGVEVSGESAVLLENATLTENGFAGVAVVDAASLTVRDTVATGNDIGYFVTKAATATIERGVASQNRLGIYTADDAAATFTDIVVENNGWVGAHAVGGGKLTLRGAAFTANTDHGVYVTDEAELVIEGGRYAGAEQQGIIVEGSASGTIEGATVEANGAHGVLVVGEATAHVVGSVLKDNGIHGIVFVDASTGSVGSSTLSGNGGCGVYLYDPGAVALEDNTYADNAGSDVCQLD